MFRCQHFYFENPPTLKTCNIWQDVGYSNLRRLVCYHFELNHLSFFCRCLTRVRVSGPRSTWCSTASTGRRRTPGNPPRGPSPSDRRLPKRQPPQPRRWLRFDNHPSTKLLCCNPFLSLISAMLFLLILPPINFLSIHKNVAFICKYCTVCFKFALRVQFKNLLQYFAQLMILYAMYFLIIF